MRPLGPRAATGDLVAVAVTALVVFSALPGLLSPTGARTVAPGGSADHGAAVQPLTGFALGYDGVSPAAISLNWTATTSTDFDNYTVFYSNLSGSGPWRYVTAITTEAAATVGVDNLEPGETYWWNVTLYETTPGLLGIGSTTTETYSTILDRTQPTLAYLTSPAHTSTSINLTWTNNASYGGGIAFGSYRVIGVSGGVNTTYANLTGGADDNATEVSGLSIGSVYSFYIETYDDCSNCLPAGFSVTQSNVVVTSTSAQLVASLSSSRTTIDTHLLVNFVCTPAGGTPPYTFGWNFTNGTTYLPGPATVSHAYGHPSTTGYPTTCKVTDHADNYAFAAPVTVYVNRDPRANASASPVNVTTGALVAFACKGSLGTTPLSVAWTLGDGDGIAGSGDTANGNASYPSNGTYIAHCVVTDAVGAKATASVLIHVSPAPTRPWFAPGLVVLLGAAAGAIVAVIAAALLRRREAVNQSSALSRWLPPTGPASVVHGVKICPKCGASNVPLRRTCQVCGTPLPRNP